VACYISSNNERLYAALEPSYGMAAAVSSASRVPAVRFGVRQQAERVQRRDKTGSRTFRGLPTNLRRQTTFDLSAYLTSWNEEESPGTGVLLQGALGAPPRMFAGGTCAAGSTATQLVLQAPHGLTPGQAVTVGGEIRFVAAAVSGTTVVLNQPLSAVPQTGTLVGATISYRPAEQLPSLNIFDYWSPHTALQRILVGAAVNRASIKVNGDFHELEFSGSARDVVDSAGFEGGTAGLTDFPAEPVGNYEYAVVPGHLGQAWLGSVPTRFFTLTSAEVTIDNGLELRDREFGGGAGGCVSAGERTVSVEFSLYERDDEATIGLYQAARQRSPISVLLQLGQQAGQMLGVWMTGVIPEVPEFGDSETRVVWNFDVSRAQGTTNDEIFIALG
jgi:hypothetical protein